jgi:hypothetical protein
MMQNYGPLVRFAVLVVLFGLAQPARADENSARIDVTTFTCQEHTDTFNGGPKSNDYTSDRQVYFMIWLAGYEDPTKKGIDPEEMTALATGVMKFCDKNPALKVTEAFKKTAADVRPDTTVQTEDANFPCFLIAAVSTSNGDNYELKTLVAWLSGQIAARANETVFDFEKFKNDTSAVLTYCSDADNKESVIGAALETLRE